MSDSDLRLLYRVKAHEALREAALKLRHLGDAQYDAHSYRSATRSHDIAGEMADLATRIEAAV